MPIAAQSAVHMGYSLVSDDRPAKRMKLSVPSQEQLFTKETEDRLNSRQYTLTSLQAGTQVLPMPLSLPPQIQMQQHQQRHLPFLQSYPAARGIATAAPPPGHDRPGYPVQTQLLRADNHPPRHRQEHSVAPFAGTTVVQMPPADSLDDVLSVRPEIILDGSWSWPSSSPIPASSHMSNIFATSITSASISPDALLLSTSSSGGYLPDGCCPYCLLPSQCRQSPTL